MLNRLRSSPPANLLEDRLAPGTIGAVYANLDQLVAFQTTIDFREDCGVQSGSTDQHDRVERVRSRLPFNSRRRVGDNPGIEKV